jgi:hypothetical protein
MGTAFGFIGWRKRGCLHRQGSVALKVTRSKPDILI